MSTQAGLYILQIYMLLKNKIEIQLTWFVGFLVYDTIKSVHHMHVLFYQVKLLNLRYTFSMKSSFSQTCNDFDKTVYTLYRFHSAFLATVLSNVSSVLFTLNRAWFPSNLGMFQMVDQLHWDAESWFGEQEADITQ